MPRTTGAPAPCFSRSRSLRKIRSHWGPIIRKTAELRPECDELFQAVATYIDDNGITDV